MKWFKHDTDANQDAKLQNVLLDYGLEGYGLYWYCLELIAVKVDKDCLTFELEHDARIIARNVGSTAQKVEEMMKYFVSIGLFECSNNTITCLKLAKRLDKSMTNSPVMRNWIGSKNVMTSADGVMTSADGVIGCHELDIDKELELELDIEKKKKRERAREACAAPPVFLFFTGDEINELSDWAKSELHHNFNFESELKIFIDYANAEGKRYKNAISAAKMNLRKQAAWKGLDKPEKHTRTLDKRFLIESEIKSLESLLEQQKKSPSVSREAMASTLKKIEDLKNELGAL